MSGPRVKCDGNHGGPRCADPECWNDTPTTLAESWAQAQADAPLDPRATPAIQGKRDFMAGALHAVLLHERGVPLQTIKAECIAFGRVVGTPAERAT